ncbi:MAG: SDR family oxidoreductase [Caldilineales bacterium]|nr:SDR family oxidoreductase [Caldilineales bacterium]
MCSLQLEELQHAYDFSGKTVVITGGTGVLGGEMACTLAAFHANVVILARNLERAQPILRRIDAIPQRKGRVMALQADVMDRDSLIAAEREVRAELGHVYAIINAAGGNRPEATTRTELPFFDLPEDALRQVFALNMMGSILPTQIFARGMAEAGEGVILNISSVAAYWPLTRTVAYSTAKAAINNFTQWLAVHMAHEYSSRIRVNALAPGFFLTDQNRYLLLDEQGDQLTARGRTIIDQTPMARFGAPDELLGAMLWLLSPLSSFVTGIVVPIDGGYTAFSGV